MIPSRSGWWSSSAAVARSAARLWFTGRCRVSVSCATQAFDQMVKDPEFIKQADRAGSNSTRRRVSKSEDQRGHPRHAGSIIEMAAAAEK